MTGTKITGTLKAGVEAFDFYTGYDESKYDYSYETFDIDYYQSIVFPEKYYFRPIETTILQKTPGPNSKPRLLIFHF
jgi:hypothetical protein